MVYRVYVEKKLPFAAEAKDMAEQLRTLYHLTGVEKVRVINRYDVEEIAPELLETAKRTVFSEPQLDDVSEELNTDGAALVFAVEYLPGQLTSGRTPPPRVSSLSPAASGLWWPPPRCMPSTASWRRRTRR